MVNRSGDGPTTESSPNTRNRIVDRMDARLVNVLTVLGFGLPLAGYFWLVHRYSINVIVGDQWDDVTVIAHSYSHLFDWSSLWAQHNENRIFFPNLIVLVLARTTSFNVQVEEYLSAAMLVASVALILRAHKRRSPNTPWLYYTPVLVLAFSFVQYENTLEGFQLAWYLVLFSLAVTVSLIDRVTLSRLTFIAAVAAAVVGSFSSVQGLLIWPAGLLLLYHRRRGASFMAVWVAAAIATTTLYFHNLNASEGAPDHGYALHHPWVALKFFVFAVGDIVGVYPQYDKPANAGVMVLGIVILGLAGWSVALYGIRRDERGAAPVGVALICVGVLFAAMITEGRIVFSYPGASQSRYTTYYLLIPIGIVLTLLARPDRREATDPPTVSRNAPGSAGEIERIGDRELEIDRIRVIYVRVAGWIMAVVIVFQFAFGLHFGLQRARVIYADSVYAANVLRNIDHTTNATVEFPLDPFYPESFVRQQARIAQLHHLSLYAQQSGAPPDRVDTHDQRPR